MELALDDAGLAPSQRRLHQRACHRHPVGDPVEIRAIRRVLKRRANHVLVNATKSLLGHTLGAAGAIGADHLRPVPHHRPSPSDGQLRRS